MPMGSVRLVPGVNIERTPTLNEAGYSTSNLGRFKDGLFQKIGGWQKFYPFNVSGVPRDLHAWQDLNSATWLSVGTTTTLGTISSSAFQDITPQTKTTNPAADFSTVNGTSNVIIVDAGISDVTILDSIFFNTPIAVGGLILSGLYPIASIVGTHSYSITAGSSATSTVNNGGAVPVFTSTSGSNTVSVALTAHGLSAGNTINFPISTTVGGVAILGTYTALSITNASNFTIAAATQASSSTSGSMNAGSVQFVYYINLGPNATGTGYGLGPYGAGGYGTGVVPVSQTGTPITSTDWTSDNWGEILVACTKNGGLYYWAPRGGYQNASLISAGPVFNGGCFVSMPAQILVAWGSTVTNTIGVSIDPLFIKWSDVSNFLNWTVSATTQAGSFRIPTGSRIVGGLQGPQQGLIWTDLDLWSMSYIGYPLIFGFNKIAGNCGLASAHAMAQLGGTVYWMGTSNFFRLAGGGVQPIPCPVWDVVFQDLDTANISKCVAAANTPFNEVFFFFPSLSGGTGQCDKYVKINTEGAWDYGSLPRSAWVDQSVLGYPVAATPTSTIYQQESGNDADGQPISASFETGYFVIHEGHEIAVVDWMIPDFKWGKYGASQTASLMITIKTVDYPGDTPRTYGPFTVTQSSQFFNPRARGRQMSIKAESTDVGSFWRLGNIRYRWAQDGGR